MAWGLKDLRELLGKLDEWARFREGLERLDRLEERVKELEQKLGDEFPPDVCKFCGKRASRLTATYLINNSTGVVRQEWQCGACDRQEIRSLRP